MGEGGLCWVGAGVTPTPFYESLQISAVSVCRSNAETRRILVQVAVVFSGFRK